MLAGPGLSGSCAQFLGAPERSGDLSFDDVGRNKQVLPFVGVHLRQIAAVMIPLAPGLQSRLDAGPKVGVLERRAHMRQ